MQKIKGYIITFIVSFLAGIITGFTITYRLQQRDVNKYKDVVERTTISLQQVKDKLNEQRETDRNITEIVRRSRERIREIKDGTTGDIETVDRIIECNRRIYFIIEERDDEK